jgi:hypothetical protein
MLCPAAANTFQAQCRTHQAHFPAAKTSHGRDHYYYCYYYYYYYYYYQIYI